MVFENLDFYGFMSWFEGIGGFDIILPFLLIFAITFAILDKVKIFDKKNINAVISVILGFFLVTQGEAVLLIQSFLPRISMIVLSMIMLLLVAGTFGFSEFGDAWKSLSVIVAIISVAWALGASAGWDVPLAGWFDDQDIAILLMVGVFVAVIWFIVKEPKDPSKSGGIGDAFKSFNDMFGLTKKK
jgi:hypothetical protein